VPPRGDGHRQEERVGHEDLGGPSVQGGPPSRIEHVPDHEEPGPGGLHLDQGRLRSDRSVLGGARIRGAVRDRRRLGDPRVRFQDGGSSGIEAPIQDRPKGRRCLRHHRPGVDQGRPLCRPGQDVGCPLPFRGHGPGAVNR
jgi:hypothetical protein